MWNEMQKGDGMFKLSFSEEQSDYCTDSKRHKIITVKKKKKKNWKWQNLFFPDTRK